MDPNNRTAAAKRTAEPETDEIERPDDAAEAETAADAGAAPVPLDPLEIRIRQMEEKLAAAIEVGQQGKIDRVVQRLNELRATKAERDKARADQALLEAADRLPDGDGFADKESTADDQPRVALDPKMAEKPDILPPAEPSRARARHWAIALSFIFMVAVPTAISAWYLWTRATDRYISRAGFSVRTEEIGSAIELLGGVANLSGSSSSDPTIIYSFIQSQEMVKLADEKLDLRKLWAKADPNIDPIYAYHPPGTIEDMTDYWVRMVKVYNDESGLIDLEVRAFAPEDAQAIAREIYEESSSLINQLSAIARADATAYARDELDKAVEQLRQARVAMTQFRNRTQIVDPSASLQSQMGILSSLQQQLAETLIDLDILRQQSVSESDPRIVQGERRVEVIKERIDEERKKLGIGTHAGAGAGDDAEAFATLLGEYESLQVDLQFAQESYTAARAAYDAAIAEARRQSRYLAAHVTPTLPERAELPNRPAVLGLVLLFSFLIWAMAVLTAYALRDRN